MDGYDPRGAIRYDRSECDRGSDRLGEKDDKYPDSHGFMIPRYCELPLGSRIQDGRKSPPERNGSSGGRCRSETRDRASSACGTGTGNL